MKHKISKLLFTAGGVILLATLAGIGLALAQGGGQLTRLTVAPDNQSSIGASLNADGTKVAFASDADFLGPDATTTTYEIWLYDTKTMTYTRITSVPVEGGFCQTPSLSGDGARVAFLSNANLISGALHSGYNEVWLYDLATKKFTQVVTQSSNFPSLSGDGSKVAYEVGLIRPEIELYDVESGEYTRVTTATSFGRSSRYPSLNSDGSKIAFSSGSDFLSQGNIGEYYSEIWLYDTRTMTYTRITTTPVISGSDPRTSQRPSLSGDGRRVVFESDADFMNEGIQDNQFEIWLYDTEAMTYTRITTSTDGYNRGSHGPRISADGRRVAFYSDSAYWDENIAEGHYEIWLYDIGSKQYTRVTTGMTEWWIEGMYPSLSVAGTRVAFKSNVDLTANPVESLGHLEIWMYEGVERMYFPMVKKGE